MLEPESTILPSYSVHPSNTLGNVALIVIFIVPTMDLHVIYPKHRI